MMMKFMKRLWLFGGKNATKGKCMPDADTYVDCYSKPADGSTKSNKHSTLSDLHNVTGLIISTSKEKYAEENTSATDALKSSGHSSPRSHRSASLGAQEVTQVHNFRNAHSSSPQQQLPGWQRQSSAGSTGNTDYYNPMRVPEAQPQEALPPSPDRRLRRSSTSTTASRRRGQPCNCDECRRYDDNDRCIRPDAVSKTRSQPQQRRHELLPLCPHHDDVYRYGCGVCDEIVADSYRPQQHDAPRTQYRSPREPVHRLHSSSHWDRTQRSPRSSEYEHDRYYSYSSRDGRVKRRASRDSRVSQSCCRECCHR